MKTTMIIPDQLMAQARRLSGAKTKTQAVIWGLEELSNKKKLERLWGLRGKISLNLDLAKSRGR